MSRIRLLIAQRHRVDAHSPHPLQLPHPLKAIIAGGLVVSLHEAEHATKAVNDPPRPR